MRMISRPVLLAAAGCGLVALAAAPAAAKTCPSGQFLQVSKGKCISKDSARELGLASGARSAAKAKPQKSEAAASKREKAGESSVAKSAGEPAPERSASAKNDAAQAETTLASAAPAIGASQSLGYAAAPSENLSVRRAIAPFGALQFGGFK